jgi:hypothetical protein
MVFEIFELVIFNIFKCTCLYELQPFVLRLNMLTDTTLLLFAFGRFFSVYHSTYIGKIGLDVQSYMSEPLVTLALSESQNEVTGKDFRIYQRFDSPSN